MEIVLQGRLCFNSISNRWDMKKGIFRRLFWLLSFWEEVNTSLGIVECPGSSLSASLLGQLGLIGCQQTSHSLTWSCGAVPGCSFPLGFVFPGCSCPLGFVFLAADELRDSEVSPGTGICSAFGLWFALQALGVGVFKTKIEMASEIWVALQELFPGVLRGSSWIWDFLSHSWASCAGKPEEAGEGTWLYLDLAVWAKET